MAREISWQALVKKADPKPPKQIPVYKFGNRVKYEKAKKPGERYVGD